MNITDYFSRITKMENVLELKTFNCIRGVEFIEYNRFRYKIGEIGIEHKNNNFHFRGGASRALVVLV